MEETNVPKWLIPDWLYDILKWLGLVVLPAAATFVGACGPQIGIPNPADVVTVITAVSAFVGCVIGATTIAAKR